MYFGDILRELLEERNITQKDLAKDLNLAPTTLGNYIRNIREPDYSTLKRIADYFHVSTDYLLDFHPHTLTSHEDEHVLQIFHSLTPDQKELYIEQGKLFIKQNNRKRTSDN